MHGEPGKRNGYFYLETHLVAFIHHLFFNILFDSLHLKRRPSSTEQSINLAVDYHSSAVHPHQQMYAVP